jgi:ATP-dependent Clp protease adaptor protein ClpS
MSEASPQIGEEIASRPKTAQEPPYRVIIHNDDVTPIDFVLEVLLRVFLLNGVRAVQVMYTAHFHGSAYVISLPKFEAQQRIHQAHLMARLRGFPLHFSMEKE